MFSIDFKSRKKSWKQEDRSRKKKLKEFELPDGQILIDFNDLRYMQDTTAEGAILVPSDRYYGELSLW